MNSAVVIASMIRSFSINILPGIPGKLSESPYGITTVHACVGIVGVALGVFVALRGNNLVPKAMRFRNYKAFMRTAYAVYMLATLLGVGVYIVTYG